MNAVQSGATTPSRPSGLSRDHATAYGRARDFLDNRFVYLVISSRARGLTLGVNLAPNKQCSFNCIYCEVDRRAGARAEKLDIRCMLDELKRTLRLIHSGELRRTPRYSTIHEELLELRDVVLSGDGEPTLCPVFFEAMDAIVQLRRRKIFPFFKLVLLTNSTGLDLPPVQEGLKLLNEPEDEIWIKLDAGTPSYMSTVNRSAIPLEQVLANVLLVSKSRPVVIQSLFSLIGGQEPPAQEIEAYAQRLNELKAHGAMISQVQIYSAARPITDPTCGHLPLRVLAQIAKDVRALTGLRAEVF